MGSEGWQQAAIEFADRQTAEHVAAGCLRPELVAAQAQGLIAGWFFIRKTPCWRVRYQPTNGHAWPHLAGVLDGLAADGRIAGWTTGVYEPEVHTFGGPAAMNLAHHLFGDDSRQVLDYLAQPASTPATPAASAPRIGRRELTMLLCSVLLRAAGQDWYEQGDLWARVAQCRPGRHPASQPERPTLKPAVYRLMTVDAGPTSRLVDGGPLAALAHWSAAFERAGQQLAELTRRGTLTRGVRAVLTHHVIFHWNRLGLSYPEQSTLAALAKEVVMADEDHARVAARTSIGSTSHG
jgi:protein-L-isoaspartate(D-aspartate) O-methyltransferase